MEGLENGCFSGSIGPDNHIQPEARFQLALCKITYALHPELNDHDFAQNRESKAPCVKCQPGVRRCSCQRRTAAGTDPDPSFPTTDANTVLPQKHRIHNPPRNSIIRANQRPRTFLSKRNRNSQLSSLSNMPSTGTTYSRLSAPLETSARTRPADAPQCVGSQTARALR